MSFHKRETNHVTRTTAASQSTTVASASVCLCAPGIEAERRVLACVRTSMRWRSTSGMPGVEAASSLKQKLAVHAVICHNGR